MLGGYREPKDQSELRLAGALDDGTDQSYPVLLGNPLTFWA